MFFLEERGGMRLSAICVPISRAARSERGWGEEFSVDLQKLNISILFVEKNAFNEQYKFLNKIFLLKIYSPPRLSRYQS